MSDRLERYELAASFIAVILRLIYDGPKLREGPLELDEATTLQTLALVARFAELTGEEPVTAEKLRERLPGVIAGEHARVAERHEAHDIEVSEEDNSAMWCAYLPTPGGGGSWWCHRIYSSKSF